MLAYRLLRRFLRLAIDVFFRKVEVVGLANVPVEGEGPVIFCGNHPNSLLDPVLITVSCRRIVHFAAKDVLFRNRLLRFFLTALGAVPIRRRRDHAGKAVSNEDAFEQLYAVLGEGRCMGIFPEGISHDRSQIQSLKTGAARIALAAAKRYPGQRIRLVPCGLHYITRDRFRSSVLVQFGEPIEVTEEWLNAHEEAERETVLRLTADIEQGLRALTVNADDWDTLRLLDGVRRLYQPRRITLEQRVELARRFNREYPRVKDEPRVQQLMGKVREYLDQLSDLGLRDADLRRDVGVVEAAYLGFRYLVFLFLWLPLALAGAVIHVPVALLLGFGGERFAPRKDVIATTKFVLGLVVLLVVYISVPVVLYLFVNVRAAILAALLLPLSGFATLRVLERAVATKRIWTTSLRMLVLGRTIRELRAHRHALEAAVVQAVHEFKPADMELLFHRDTLTEEDSL